MFEIKSIKLYFFSIKKIISLKINNTYFKSNFYHKKITKTYSSRFYYIPRPNLIEPLILSKNYFYNIKDVFKTCMIQVLKTSLPSSVYPRVQYSKCKGLFEYSKRP